MSTGRQQPAFSLYPGWDEPDMPLSFEACDNRFPPSQSTLPASISLPFAGDKLFVQNHGYPPSQYRESVADKPADLCAFLLHLMIVGFNPQRSKPVLTPTGRYNPKLRSKNHLDKGQSMKSPGGCFTALIPMLIALLFLWRNGHLVWLCWAVTGLAILSWLVGEAVVHSKIDAENEPEKEPIYRFWLYFYGPLTLLLWLLCGASIIASFL